MANREIVLLCEILEQAYDHKSWHGTNLCGSIRGLQVEVASFRPGAGRHNIWEIVVHAAYWKYAVCRRLIGDPRGSFPLKGSNWFLRPAATGNSATAWKDDVKLLEENHQRLLQAVADLQPAELDKVPPGGKYSRAFLISGVAAHDLYHAGQIQLLKRLLTKKE